MSRRAPALAAALLALTLAVGAGLAWWFDARTRPGRVGPRFVDGVVERHPGATIAALDGGLLRVALPSGVLVDVAVSRVFADCARDRAGCTAAIHRALDDVDAADSATRSPDRASLRPAIVTETSAGRYGFVAEPLVGPYEIRYALVHGVASTFVTMTMTARLGLSPASLREAAIANLDTETGVALEAAGADLPGVYRVRSNSDPVASLLDVGRMRRFADAIGARRLYAAIPVRGTLALAAIDDASARALDALRARLRGPGTVDGGLLVFDVDAPAGSRLSTPGRTRALSP